MKSPFIKVEEPLTLGRLEQLLERFVLAKVKLIHEVLRNGVMDFLIAEDDQH
jgi:hypothetical protein